MATKWWLKVGLLLDEAGDSILSNCFIQILESFGGYKALLKVLSKSLNVNELQTMHGIVLNELRREQLKKLKSLTIESTESHYSASQCAESRNMSLFRLLPNVSIANICSYLTKENVSKFKLCSKQIGIVCLDEMEKIFIKTINGNNILSDSKSECQCLLDLAHFDTFRFARYYPNRRFYALYDEWEQIYKIPQQNQLIYEVVPDSNHFKLRYFDSDCCRLNAIGTNSSFLVYDKRNVVVLSNESVHRFVDLNIGNFEEYNLMQLEYFCVYTQTLHIAQTILYKNGLTKEALFGYMQHHFICLNEDCNEWYNVFKNECELTQNEVQFRLYEHRDTDIEMHALSEDIIPFDSNGGHYKFTFQLIPNSRRLVSARTFCSSLTSFKVSYNGTVSQLHDIIGDNDLLNLDIESILNPLVIRTSRHILTWNLKIKICKMRWKGLFSPQYIEIFAKDDHILNEDNLRYIDHAHPIGNGDFEYKLCLHDSTALSVNKEHFMIYKLRIFDPLSNPYPIYFDDCPAQEMIIKYSNTFTPQTFINYIFVTMQKAILRNNPFYKIYEKLVDFYYNKYENKVKCVLCPSNLCTQNKFKYITPYAEDERHEYMTHTLPSFDMFLLKVRGKSIERPLLIKFIANERHPIAESLNTMCASSDYEESFLSESELRNLEELDEIDHRDVVGKFVLSEIVETEHEMNRVLVHYQGWSSRYDVWCDYKEEAHRFARANSISRLETDRLNNLRVGDRVDLCRNAWNEKEAKWRTAKIKRFDSHSSQVEVMYVKEVSSEGIRGYRRWVHADAVNEIDYYGMRLFASAHHRERVNECKFIGLPLKVWVNSTDTLKDIIEKNMNGSSKYIHSVYRVNKEQNKMMKIAKYKQRSYVPFNEFEKGESEDFIVIKIQTNKVKDGYIPIYPAFVQN